MEMEENICKKVLFWIFMEFPGFVDCELLPSLPRLAEYLRVDLSQLKRCVAELREKAMEERKKQEEIWFRELLQQVSKEITSKRR
jgi:hypothetical protein